MSLRKPGPSRPPTGWPTGQRSWRSRAAFREGGYV